MAIDIIQVGLIGRDHFRIEFVRQGTSVVHKKMSVKGSLESLELIHQLWPTLGDEPETWQLPQGTSSAALLLRELILKVQGLWTPPYTEEELCHCRSVPTQIVDQAILCGARSVGSVSRQTSAGTGCGSCQKDASALIAYRCAFFGE